MTTAPVNETHRFDEAALAAWLAANVEGYQGPLQVREFMGGQSNPTYQLVTPTRAYVMRRKPPGRLVRSAHAVDREHRVISALHPTGFPVPRPYALCVDDSVIGTMFYVMEMVEGRIIWDASLPDSTPGERRAIQAATLRTLADLHNTDWRAIGLEGFAAPGNYMLRQIDRWTKQYGASQTARIETMERLIEWLPRTAPEQGRTTIIHGDYKLANMVTHPTEPRIAAVLDWELATLGEPVADFAYLMMPWVNGPIAEVADLEAHGIPTVADCVAEYCRLTGRTDGLPHLDWFFAFNFFRLGAILQGIVGRVRDGTANAPDAATMEERVPLLAEAAWKFAVKAGA